MDFMRALKGQYRAGLEMLRQCIERCPDGLWIAGEHPRTFWRIAYHGIFYTHLYSQPNLESFVSFEDHDENVPNIFLDEDEAVPPLREPYTKEHMLRYVKFVDENIESWVDSLDMNSPESGFYWYKNFPKIDHQILNVRHLQGHVGQLSELLMSAGVDIDWVSRVPR